MSDFRQDFIRFAVEEQVLRFGEFVTKAGRPSPYFFNAGLFDHGASLLSLARFYARSISESGIAFDMLFGPAYKGIVLAGATAMMLAEQGRDVPFAFNRKEAKDHGEGGTLIGADMAGKRILIVDDVITAGTAIREALAIIREAGGTPAGIIIALDRQERVREDAAESAAQAVAAEHAIPVVAVAGLSDLLAFAGESAALAAHREALLAYRARYGVV